MIKEMILLLAGSWSAYAALDTDGFALASLLGFALGVGVWSSAAWLTRLWNRSFTLSWFHHLLCGLAAGYTVFCVVSFASLREVDEVVAAVVQVWNSDTDLLLGIAPPHEQVNRFGRSDAQPVDPALTDNHQGPEISPTTLFNAFRAGHPFLAKLLGDTPLDLAGTGKGDNAPATANLVSSIAYAIAGALQTHMADLLLRLRVALVLSFLLFQAAALGLLAYSANRDLKPVL